MGRPVSSLNCRVRPFWSYGTSSSTGGPRRRPERSTGATWNIAAAGRPDLVPEKPRPHSVRLFTNRNCIIFDKDGGQIAEDQNAIDCYQLDKEAALRITLEAEEFYLTAWGRWEHAITREEMQYLLGIRTREMDFISPSISKSAGWA
jgi:hypothetical protein